MDQSQNSQESMSLSTIERYINYLNRIKQQKLKEQYEKQLDEQHQEPVDENINTNYEFVFKVYLLLIFETVVNIVLIIDKNHFLALNFIPTFDNWVFWTSLALTFLIQCLMNFCQGFTRKAPINYIIFIIYLITNGFCLNGIFMLIIPEALYFCQVNILIIIILLTLATNSKKCQITLRTNNLYLLMIPGLILWIISSFIISTLFVNFIVLCFIYFYTWFLLWESEMIFMEKRVSPEIDEHIIPSLMLDGLFFQFILRIFDLFETAFGNEK